MGDLPLQDPAWGACQLENGMHDNSHMICGSGDDDNIVQHHIRILPGPVASLDDRTSPSRIFTWQISVNTCGGTVLLWRVLGEILHAPQAWGGLAMWTVKPRKPLKVG